MNSDLSEYYVYVYIDPRNFEEFYFGKGKGNRKNAHLNDDTRDSEKAKRIKAIKQQGLQPIIKVIAKGLTEKEAFLVEKTLIWKLGKILTNQSSGHFANKFRPHNTLHLNLNGFDYNNGLYYVNVGDGETRSWEDCKNFNFMSAGQHPKYSDPIRTLEIGDIVVAYLKGHGYVGVGEVLETAIRINDFRIEGKTLRQFQLKQTNIFRNSDNQNSEYLIKVNWLKAVEAKAAKWKKNSKLFSSQLIKASLQNQPITIQFVEKAFGVDFNEILLGVTNR